MLLAFYLPKGDISVISYQTASLLETIADEMVDKANLSNPQRATILDIMIENLGDTLTSIGVDDSYSSQGYSDERFEEQY